MTYKATRDMVRRVMPLIDQLAETRIDKARLVQYLAASFGVDLGVMEIVADRETDKGRTITYRDKYNESEHDLVYPSVLEPHIEPLVLAEYKRLAVEKPLTKMDRGLFDYLFKDEYCDHCKFRGPEYAQFHNECFFAGHPINFEAE
jgi:hypothetical protein